MKPNEKVGKRSSGTGAGSQSQKQTRAKAPAPARGRDQEDKRWRKVLGRELFTRLQKAARRDGMAAEEVVAHAVMHADRYAMMALVREYGSSFKTLAALVANWVQPSHEGRRLALVEAGYRLEVDGWQTPEAAGIPEPEKGTEIPKTGIMRHSKAHGFYLYDLRRPCRMNGRVCSAHRAGWALYDALAADKGAGRVRVDVVYEPERAMVKRLTPEQASERIAEWTAREIPEMFRQSVKVISEPSKVAA